MARKINTTTANIINRTASVTAFLEGIRRYSVMTTEEEQEIFEKISNCTDEAVKDNLKNEVINSNLRFVFSLCSCFAKGDEILDLVFETIDGVKKCIDTFEYQRGTRFIYYAVHYMREGISEYFRKNGNLVRQTNNNKIGSKANKLAEKFYQSEMRMPTEEELVDMLNSEYNIAIKDRYEVIAPKVSSLNDIVGEEGEEAGEIGELAMVMSSQNDYEVEIENEAKKALCDKLLSILPVRERAIVEMFFGCNEERIAYDYDAIAEKYGLTSERVRQICTSSIAKLKANGNRIRKQII